MDTDNRLVVATGVGVGGAVEWKVRASRCKLLCGRGNKIYCVAQGTVASNL